MPKTGDMSNKKNNDPNNGGEDSDYSSEEENNQIDMKQYRKFLADIFPSKYARKRAETTTSSRKHSDNSSNTHLRRSSRLAAANKTIATTTKSKKNGSVDKSEKKSDTITTQNHTKNKHRETDSTQNKNSELNITKKPKKRIVLSDTDESDDEKEEANSSDSENSDYDSDSSEDTDKALDDFAKQGVNIVFVVGGENEEDDDDDSDDESYTEVNSNSETESDEYSHSDSESESESNEVDTNSKNVSEDESQSKTDNIKSSLTNTKDALEQFKQLIEQIPKDARDNNVYKSMTKQYEKLSKEHKTRLNKRFKKERAKNTKEFKSMLKEKNIMNDTQYFKKKLGIDEQRIVLKQLDELKKHCTTNKPYRLQLLDSPIPPEFKAAAYKKLNTLQYMEPSSGEYYKLKQWIDTFMQIPFGIYKSLPLTINDGMEACNKFMTNATSILDEAVYGLNDAKYQIMQLVGQWISNPTATGTSIAIKGPMGTGKTTLVKEGISKILGRDFAFIALGGATDSSFLEGHSYTYEGAIWGKIVDILVQSKSMNPVIFLDELDKVSTTPKGEEIIGILTHLTDTTQNTKFHDKYFSEIDLDLSRCLFIFSYNDEKLVNPILRDRMYRVETNGYTMADKKIIAYKYLLPKIQKQVNIEEGQVIIPDETLSYIIANFTEEEKGVRNLKRCLEIIYTKLNLYRLMEPGSELFTKAKSLNVSFPITVTIDVINKLITKKEDDNSYRSMYL